MSLMIASTVDEALQSMANGARPIAGGTDLVVGARHGKAPLPAELVAIDRIAELATITSESASIRIGAGVTHATLMTHADVPAGVADAAALVGSPSTRNVGTIGGNIMNASPAMDTGAPLLALGAEAELQSVSGTRHVPLAEIWTGPGSTTARADELCIAIHVPSQPVHSASAYVRLEYRRAMEIAVVGAGAAVTLQDDGTIASVRVALSAVAPTIVEVMGLNDLVGQANDADTHAKVAALASEQAAPISDLRASDTYRRHCIGVMARRAVDAAARRAGGEEIAVPVNRALGIGAA